MTTYSPSFCIIDDQIPSIRDASIIPGKIINESNLNLLLNDSIQWDELELRALVRKMLDEQYKVNAFINPYFYENYVKDDGFKSDIVIFDWDTGTGDSPKDLLLKVLKLSYSIIAIFSRTDEITAIERVISGEEFLAYGKRIIVVSKQDSNSINQVLDKSREKYEQLFSYKFASTLRTNLTKSLEDLLIQLGEYDESDIIRMFGEKNEETNNYSLDQMELVNILVEKIRNNMISTSIEISFPEIPDSGEAVYIDIVKKLWEYRLYYKHYKPSDNKVMKGDLIKMSGVNDKLFLVITSDCHLKCFWKNNLGHLTIVPLEKLSNVREKLSLYNSWSSLKNNIKPTSIVNVSGISNPAPLIFPSIEHCDYMLFPKEILNVKIELPTQDNIESIKRKLPLKYDHCSNIQYVMSLSEPFLTPVIQHIINNITGYGAPDFPSKLITSIKESIEGL